MIMIILEWTLSIKLNCDEREKEDKRTTMHGQAELIQSASQESEPRS